MSVARITVPLDHAVLVDGIRYTALHLRPVKKTDRRRARGGTQLEVGIDFAARLAGVPVAVIYALDEADADRVGNVVKSLLG